MIARNEQERLADAAQRSLNDHVRRVVDAHTSPWQLEVTNVSTGHTFRETLGSYIALERRCSWYSARGHYSVRVL
jgi:hypothetical protein